MRNKLICTILGAAMCVSGMVMPVSAAEDVSEICTFDNYTSTKFDLPTGWEEINGNSNRPDKTHEAWYGENAPYMGTELYAKQGLFGKQADDTAFDVNTIWRNNDKAYNSRWYQARYVMAQNLEGRRYVKSSYETAFDGTRSNRWFQIQFYDGKTFKDSAKLVEVSSGSAEGNVIFKIGGEESQIAIPEYKWIKFDFVSDLQEKTADIYMNGKLVKENYDLGLGDFVPTRLNGYIYGVNAIAYPNGNGSYAAHTYLDNVSYLMTDTKPTVDSYTAPDVIDFQSYEGAALPQGYDYTDGTYKSFTTDTQTNQTQYKYNGLRGKAADDISWRISAPETKDNADEYQCYRWDTNLKASTNSAGFVKFSTEFCMEGAAMTRGISIKTTHDGGWADNDIIKITKENGEQAVTIGGGIDMSNNVRTSYQGKKAALDLPMSVVMKIDVVIDRREKENNKFDLYINGEKVAENEKMPTSYISNVSEVILYAQQKWESNTVWQGENKERNCFIASDTYFDNMEIGKYYTYPEIASYTSPSVTVMSTADDTVTPIDPQTFGHWVPLRGYDSKYYYYAENVSMPADNATRAYDATFGKLSDNTAIITSNKILEVVNGAVKVYGKDIAATVPTNRQFKLSFLFDIMNKTYNVYVDDQAMAVNVKFDTNNGDNPITEFSSIENTVTADDQPAAVFAQPIASGAFTKLPEYAKFYELINDGTSVTATLLSDKLAGKLILAAYGSDNTCKSVALSTDNNKTVTVSTAAADTAKLMLWDNDMVPVMEAVAAK